MLSALFRRPRVLTTFRNRRAKSSAPLPFSATIFHAATKDRVTSGRMLGLPLAMNIDFGAAYKGYALISPWLPKR